MATQTERDNALAEAAAKLAADNAAIAGKNLARIVNNNGGELFIDDLEGMVKAARAAAAKAKKDGVPQAWVPVIYTAFADETARQVKNRREE